MFLIERIAGISVYCFFLFIICGLILYSNIKVSALLKWYTLFLAVLGAFYKPSITGDLYRTYQALDWYASFSFRDFFQVLVLSSTTPVSRLLYWVIGKTGIHELLPFVSALFCYSSIFYMIDKTYQKYQISRKTVVYTLLFLMASSIYISVIGGIRMMVALSAVSFAFFQETVEGKMRWIHVLLYLCAIFIHNMGIVILAILVIAAVFKKSGNIGGKILLFLLIAVLLLVLYIFDNRFFDELLEKGSDYITDPGYSDKWEYGIGFLMLIVQIWALTVYHKQLQPLNTFSELHALALGLQGSLATGVLFFTSFSVFYRFIGHVAVILGLPVFMICMENAATKVSKTRRKLQVQNTILLLCALIMIISLTRGSLSALKFFVLNG